MTAAILNVDRDNLIQRLHRMEFGTTRTYGAGTGTQREETQYLERCCPNKGRGTTPGFTFLLPCLHLLGFHWPKLVGKQRCEDRGLPACSTQARRTQSTEGAAAERGCL